MYLVTGGSGFCGIEIVRELLAHGERVRILDVEEPPAGAEGAEFLRGDIRDAAFVRRASVGAQWVIHTAAKVPISKAGRAFGEVNVGGTRNVLAAARAEGAKKVVHISSSAVQMSDTNPVPENAPYRPVGLYAKTKMEAELVCHEFRASGLAIDILRPRTVVGVGRLGIFDILFDWVRSGKKIYILGNGSNRIQLLHSTDLAHCAYLSSKHSGSADFNIGSRSFGTLREDLESLIRFAGTRSEVVGLPVWPAMAALAAFDALRLSPLASWHYRTYHRDFYFSNEAARLALGWQPKFSNGDVLSEAYKAYVSDCGARARYGTSHRKSLHQGLLGVLKRLS